MAKKIALVNPGREPNFTIHAPMNLGFIAAYLEKDNIEVKIIDQLAGDNVFEEISKYSPDIVGITATTPVVNDAYEIADYCRSKGILTIMGGVHVRFLSEEALNHCDIVIKGEGEQAMLDIIRDGIKSGIVSRPYIKILDEIPSPAWHLMNMEFYLKTRDRLPNTHLNIFRYRSRVAAIMTTRGCPYRCIFCCNSWRDTPVRFFSPEWVIASIQYLIEKYKTNVFYFADDDFFCNKSRLKKIFNLFKQNKIKIKWSCQARADTVNEEILNLAKKFGCRQIQFGFESGSQRILDILKNRTTTVEENAHALELCKKVGISTFATFMIGNPTETIEDIEMTLKFIKENNPDAGGCLITTPFPGTELWDWCAKHNLIPERIDYKTFTTAQISIFACDTISPEIIEKYRLEICHYFDKLKFSDIIRIAAEKPISIINTLRNPLRTFKILTDRNFLKMRK